MYLLCAFVGVINFKAEIHLRPWLMGEFPSAIFHEIRYELVTFLGTDLVPNSIQTERSVQHFIKMGYIV
jgi:hypothetical protein